MKLTDKNLSKKILDGLREECKVIPEKGFMAGGAVANTIFSIFWGDKPYPINDIDIFYETKRASTPFYSWDRVHTPMRSDSLTIVGDGYDVTKCVYDSNVTYKVLTTRRDGLINFIEISSISDRNRDYMYILKGFDLNCCQAGIDLETGELLYTKEFEELLFNKQLDVTSFYTPAHTAIRIFKKIYELGLYCNVEQCMSILSQPLTGPNVPIIKSLGFSTYFSTKYKDLYQKYYRELSKYFTMVKFFDHKKQLWAQMNDVVNRVFDEDHASNWLDPKNTIPTHLLDRWANYKNLWTLVPKKEYNNYIVEKCLDSFRLYNPISLRIMYDLTKANKKIINKLHQLVDGKNIFTCKIFLLTVDGFIECDFTEKHVDAIEDFFARDNWLVKVVIKNKLNLQNTYKLVNVIKKIYKKEGNWVSRLLERIIERNNTNIELLYDFKLLYEQLLIEKKSLEDDFIEPIDLSFITLPSDITIKELTSEYMLRWAGHKLKNCINDPQQNYKHKIESGYSRLFLIETKNNLSAMEIRLEGIEYKISQLLSFCNKETSIFHKTIGELFTQKLSLHTIEKNVQKRINTLNKSITLHSNLLLSLPDDDTKNNETRFGGGYVNPPDLPFGEGNHPDIDINEVLNIMNEPLDIEDPFDIDDIINRG